MIESQRVVCGVSAAAKFKKLYQKDRAGFEKPMNGFVRYIFAAAPFTDKQKLATIVSEIDQQAGGTMLSLAEHIREESLAEGRSQGISQGIEKGVEEEKRRLVLKMLKKGKRPEEVADLTDQSLDRVKELLKLSQENNTEFA